MKDFARTLQSIWDQILTRGIWAVPLFFFFICHLPSTVQTGDTGELVTNALRGGLNHPPGYPLYSFLYGIFVHALPVGTVFWRAALLTALLASLAVAWILPPVKHWDRRLSWIQVVCVLLGLYLASSETFWRYAILPDVFALHLFLMAALLVTLELSRKHGLARALSPWCFALGMTNHLTFIFLLPLFLYETRRYWKEKLFLLNMGLASLAALLIYGALYFTNGDTLSSWGGISNFSDWLHHVLRRDYGTFQLSASKVPLAASLPIFLRHFLSSEPLLLLAILVSLLLVLRRGKVWTSLSLCTSLCTLFYIFCFLPLAKLPDSPSSPLILERFFLSALFLLVASCIRCLIDAESARPVDKWEAKGLVALAIILGLGAAYNLYRNRSVNNYAANTVVEDFARHVLENTPHGSSAILTFSDTEYTALIYAQSVLGIRPDVAIVHPKLLKLGWYRARLQKNFPTLKILDTQGQDISLENDLRKPNRPEWVILSTLNLSLMAPPQGLRSVPPEPIDPKTYSEFRDLFSRYGHAGFARGMDSERQQKWDEARAEYERVFMLIPYAWPALEGICRTLEAEQRDHSLCRKKVEEFRLSTFNYF